MTDYTDQIVETKKGYSLTTDETANEWIDIQNFVDESEQADFVVVLCRLIRSCFSARNPYSVDFVEVEIVDFLMVGYFSLTF